MSVLNDGTWLHWPPHLDDQFADAIKIGDTLEAVGFVETAPRGEVHFEVRRLTNTRTNTTVQNPELADRGPIGIDAPRWSPGVVFRAVVNNEDCGSCRSKLNRL